MYLTRRDALTVLLASVPVALLSGCGGGEGGDDNENGYFNRTRYIALGDSYAYGYTNRGGTPTGLGDIGYVKLFANALTNSVGGVRPEVQNLAIPGETTTTFLRTSRGTPALDYNRNYEATNSLSQHSLLVQRTAFLPGDESINWVTLHIGGDDLLHLLVDPTFLTASAAQRLTLINAALETLSENMRVIVAQMARIRNLTPSVKLFVLGYPDPFAGLGAANPIAGLSTPLAQQVNAILAQAAGEVSARFVDLFTPFAGQEKTLTLITQQDPPGSGIPDFHPSAAGYARIAELLVAANSL